MTETVLKIGDRFLIPNEEGDFRIAITHLGTETTFMATGSNVKNPENPRTLPTVVLANWMKSAGATRIEGE